MPWHETYDSDRAPVATNADTSARRSCDANTASSSEVTNVTSDTQIAGTPAFARFTANDFGGSDHSALGALSVCRESAENEGRNGEREAHGTNVSTTKKGHE
jgi:hypothetical protein